jgi:Na+/H+ antiporter
MALLLVVVIGVAITALSRRFNQSSPLLLVGVGLVLSLIPSFPVLVLDPKLVLLAVLPPLLYSAALESSYIGIRTNARPIGLLSVGLVLFSTVVVGYTAYRLIPALGLPLALAFGAIVAPPDAVAATAVGRTLGLPRRVLTILGGESLVNDATALTAYRVALAAVIGGATTWWGAGSTFLLAAGGGIVVGYLGGVFAFQLLRRLHDAVLESAFSLLLPFCLYYLAEEVHASGVIAVVVAGLIIGHRAPRTLSYANRLQSESVWRLADLLLESVVFLLIGLQLRAVLSDLGDVDRAQLAWWSIILLGTVVTIRFIWVYPATYLPRLIPTVAARDPSPSWKVPTVIGWAGMRGVVSLAAAFALPLVMADGKALQARNLVVFLTFIVVIGTLVIQGLTLPWLIRRLELLSGPEDTRDVLSEAQATNDAVRAGVDRLDAMLERDEDPSPEVIERLRERARQRSNAAWERMGAAGRETPEAAYRRLRRAMMSAERDVLVSMRDQRKLDDEVLRRAQRDLDVEEASLDRD